MWTIRSERPDLHFDSVPCMDMIWKCEFKQGFKNRFTSSNYWSSVWAYSHYPFLFPLDITNHYVYLLCLSVFSFSSSRVHRVRTVSPGDPCVSRVQLKEISRIFQVFYGDGYSQPASPLSAVVDVSGVSCTYMYSVQLECCCTAAIPDSLHPSLISRGLDCCRLFCLCVAWLVGCLCVTVLTDWWSCVCDERGCIPLAG